MPPAMVASALMLPKEAREGDQERENKESGTSEWMAARLSSIMRTHNLAHV
jgi:hypothetical protein